ncbi:CHAD domain-containing protein [Pseudomonas lopnurensis]|uniref:CHAD domain-containing protein n=1 Tax=Pseudomonas lopnurensis TaxID=1477517 RepID=UPI0028AB3F97|nr:CHAD domain-containing protein [Pseudomonas lopnurensis]
MAYRIRPRRNAAKQVRKAALDRISEAMRALALPAAQRAEGVHQARKRFKELRALLRLMREPLGGAFARENRCVRDLGRALSESREATAMLESWDALAEAHRAVFACEPLQQVRQRLAQRAEPAADDGALEASIEQALRQLRELAVRVDDWPLDGKGFALLEAGLERSYREGRRDLARAQRDPGDECLHEWRKRVKDQWYHSQLLAPCWPGAFDCRCKQLKRLADDLGDDHDLAMMRQLLVAEPALFGEPVTRERIATLIEERRAELRASAFARGRRLYAEPPKALVARMEAYWGIARAERG